MEVTCPACATRYTADDEKLRGKTARMRCKACGTAWLVSGPGAGPAVGSAISTPPPTSVVASPHAPVPGPAGPKVAAVVKRGNERDSRDLFAEREPEMGGVRPTSPPPSFGFTAGARNEDSVLFRLDQLPPSVRFKTLPPGGTPPVDRSSLAPARPAHDEGVIDLRSLSEPPPALRPAPMVVAPLFSEPPPAVSMEIDPRVPPPTSKLRLVANVAAGLVALMCVGAGLAFAFKGEEPVKHTPAAVLPPAEVAPPPKAPDPIPPSSATAAADEQKDKDAKETKGKKGKKARGVRGVITNKTPPPTPRAVKAADPCGCKGDFNCILACTAKGGK